MYYLEFYWVFFLPQSYSYNPNVCFSCINYIFWTMHSRKWSFSQANMHLIPISIIRVFFVYFSGAGLAGQERGETMAQICFSHPEEMEVLEGECYKLLTFCLFFFFFDFQGQGWI